MNEEEQDEQQTLTDLVGEKIIAPLDRWFNRLATVLIVLQTWGAFAMIWFMALTMLVPDGLRDDPAKLPGKLSFASILLGGLCTAWLAWPRRNSDVGRTVVRGRDKDSQPLQGQ